MGKKTKKATVTQAAMSVRDGGRRNELVREASPSRHVPHRGKAPATQAGIMLDATTLAREYIAPGYPGNFPAMRAEFNKKYGIKHPCDIQNNPALKGFTGDDLGREVALLLIVEAKAARVL
jgi:hypothetical protein